MPSPICFRLSEECITVIDIHAQDLGISKHKQVTRTEALEDIIQQFNHRPDRIIARVKQKLHIAAKANKSLEQYGSQIAQDQLQESLF